jgi:exosortase/archaeosortase family protein
MAAVTATALPHPTAGEVRIPGASKALRVTMALVMLAGAGMFLWGSRVLRAAELVVTGSVMSLGAGHTVLYSPAHIIFFETAGSRTVGLQITASCTAIFLMVPFFLLAAFMMLIPRLQVARLLLGVAVSLMVVFWLNQLRLLIIAWATHRWGIGQGFDWAHILAGAVVTTMSMLIALYLFFRLSLAGRPARPAPLGVMATGEN